MKSRKVVWPEAAVPPVPKALISPLPNESLAHQIEVGKPLNIWARAVHFDHVNKPALATSITFELLNAKTGLPIAVAAPDSLLNPAKIETRDGEFRGFSYGYVVFTTSNRDVYRIRARYKDAGIDSYSLGPEIVVF